MASVAYVGYCSSDAWFGNAEAFRFQFRGQSIVAAALQDLLQFRGLKPGARLLFGGCSAGARGAMVHLDNVAAALDGIEVRGLLDSGIWIDAQPTSESVEPLAEETQQVFAFADPGALIPAACAAMYPGAEAWKCLFGQYRMPFVTTPYFANEAQFDSFQVDYNNDGQARVTSERGGCSGAARGGSTRERGWQGGTGRWLVGAKLVLLLLCESTALTGRHSPIRTHQPSPRRCRTLSTRCSGPRTSSCRCARRCCRSRPRRRRAAGCSPPRACSTASPPRRTSGGARRPLCSPRSPSFSP